MMSSSPASVIFDIEAKALQFAVFPHVFKPCAVLKDLFAAFPSIGHRYLRAVLQAYGIDFRIIHAVQQFYRNANRQVVFHGYLYDGIHMKSGVKKGDPMSTLLFDIVLNLFCFTVNDIRSCERDFKFQRKTTNDVAGPEFVCF
jgi:hypothetical protein